MLDGVWTEKWVRALGRLLLSSVGAGCIWAYSVSHFIIHWGAGAPKVRTAGALLVLLGLVVFHSTRRGGRVWRHVWLLVLAIFAVGEIHRLWLRGRYRVDAEPLDPFSVVTTTDLKIRSYDLVLPALATSRLRVLHLTDLHVTPAFPESYDARVFSEIQSIAPDLVVLTGDYVTGPDRVERFERWVARLPVARYGAYAVLGNHDYWAGRADAVRAALEKYGVKVLSGKCETVTVRDAAPLDLCGTDAPWGPESPALSRAPHPTFLLSHTPDNVYSATGRGADAVFSGHTHGGQFRLPLLGAILVPSHYGRRFDRGHFQDEGVHLFVSAGLGADAPPLRLFCPPELVVVDFRGAGPPRK
jgi:predicted MPP superfamily phosphohydrolase